MTVAVTIFGAARTVTGSCLLLATDQVRVLVDCGMFQGAKTLKALNYEPFPFDPASLDAVLLTHAHIDHSGLIPKLIKAGFTGAIHATRGTRDLCSVLFPDAGNIQETEVAILNRRNTRRGRAPVVPIYTGAEGTASLRAFRVAEFEAWFEPAAGLRARFWNAGHILGSASVELEFARQGAGGAPLRILVSGDLGPGQKALQEPPRSPTGLDYVFCEATYGDVDRPPLTAALRRDHLAAEIRDAVNDDGALLIPAFAVERTQELLLDLVTLMEAGEIPSAPIFLDSPLAIRATKVFARNAAETDSGKKLMHALRSSLLRFTETETQSRTISKTSGFRIILAGSGMCDAGRIRFHLKQWLWKRNATVLLIGYQAHGTLGRILLDGATAVRIHGDEVSVRARVRSMDEYSGHADCGELAGWIAARQPIAHTVFLVHGEEPALRGLAARIAGMVPGEHGIVVPLLDDTYELTAAGVQAREPPAVRRLAPELVAREDWHNERSHLILDLAAQLESEPDDQARHLLIGKLRGVLDAARGHRHGGG
jgi:metallo-beta-lactamase family protein